MDEDVYSLKKGRQVSITCIDKLEFNLCMPLKVVPDSYIRAYFELISQQIIVAIFLSIKIIFTPNETTLDNCSDCTKIPYGICL